MNPFHERSLPGDSQLQAKWSRKVVRITEAHLILMATHPHPQTHQGWHPVGVYLKMSSGDSNMQLGLRTNTLERQFLDLFAHHTFLGETHDAVSIQ